MARLGDVCTINMGQSPDSSTYNEENIGLPFFQGNADFGTLHPSARIWCSAPVKIAKKNDILISVRAPIGALNIADTECCIGRGLAALTVYPTVCEQKYLWYGLESKVEELNSKGTGSTFKAINKSVLFDTELPLPSLIEQAHIASVLEKVSDLIAMRKQQLTKLDELVKARFVEMFRNIGNFKYPITAIGTVAKLQGGYAFKSSDYCASGVPLVQISNVNRGNLDWDEINCVPFEFLERYSGFKLQSGDLVMAMTRPVIKSLNAVKIAFVAESDTPCLLNQRVGRFCADWTKINPVYLMACCQMQDFKDYVVAMSGNSLQPNISSKQVENFKIILPPIELQNDFAAFVERTDKSRLTIRQGLDKLETLKKALVQKCFG